MKQVHRGKTNLEHHFIFMEKNVIFVCYYLLSLKPTLYLVYFFKILTSLKWGQKTLDSIVLQ